MPASDRRPKMLGQGKKWADLLERNPSDVAAPANARFGKVCVGAEANQWSQTANPRAKPDSTGSIAGVYMPMMSEACVPGSESLKCLLTSKAMALLKFLTNPSFVGAAPGAGSAVENNWMFVFWKPSPGSAPGMK